MLEKSFTFISQDIFCLNSALGGFTLDFGDAGLNMVWVLHQGLILSQNLLENKLMDSLSFINIIEQGQELCKQLDSIFILNNVSSIILEADNLCKG